MQRYKSSRLITPGKLDMNWNKVTITKDTRKNRSGYLARWYGDYDPKKDAYKRYCRSFSTRKEAELFAATKQSQINEGEPKDPVTLTLKQLCDDVIRIKEKEIKAATTTGYYQTRDQLFAFFGPHTKIITINKQKATEFIVSRKLISESHLKSGKTDLSGWGYKFYLKHCSAIFGMGVEFEYLKRNPFSRIKLSTPASQDWHFFNKDEFESILKHTPDFRLQCLYAVMYGTGLRIGEALSLLWNGKDVDFEHNRINLKNRAGMTNLPPFSIKDHQNRSIPMPDWLTAMLVKLQNMATPQYPFVFLSDSRWRAVQKKWALYRAEKKTNQWQNRDMCNNLLRNFKGHCRKAGIKTDEKFTIHCLRKSYAQNLANHNIPIATLKNLMGHSSIRCTETYYLKASTPNEQAAVNVLNTLFSTSKTTQDAPE